jgi:hypothetical protein
MTATIDDIKQLFAEFPKEDISWRGGNVSKDGNKALAMAYIDARDVMDRLDQIVGPENWQDRYEFHGARTVCYISINIDGEWVTKADGAGDTDFEGEKGGISDAFKRAAVKWGVGRYLYSMKSIWVPCASYEKNNKRIWQKWTADPWDFVNQQNSDAKPKAQSREQYTLLKNQIDAMKTAQALADFWVSPSTKAIRATLPNDWHKELTAHVATTGQQLKAAEAELNQEQA